MYRVIIVEDELFVRLGIKLSVDWEKLGMEVCADAANGQEGLAAYEKYKPHIVITDLKMPIMDGMQMIRKIREKDADTRIIILSCLEEFGLAQQAVSLNVSDYILKLTMTQEEMEQILSRAAGELRRQSPAELPEPHLPNPEEILQGYLFSGRYGEGEFSRLIGESGAALSEKNLVLAVMMISNYQGLQSTFHDETGKLIHFALMNVLSELIEGSGLAAQASGGRYVMVFSFTDMQSGWTVKKRLTELLQKVRRVFQTLFQCQATFGVSETRDSFRFLHEMYAQARQAVDSRYFYGLNQELFSGSESEITNYVSERLVRFRKETDLLSPELSGQVESASAAFAEDPRPEMMNRLICHLVTEAVTGATPEGKRRFSLTSRCITRVEEAETMDDALEVYRSCVENLYGTSPDECGVSRIMAAVLSYIAGHYLENISLVQIAEHIELSPNYLCSLFKKEMGINISQYIMNFRVEKAKGLLLSTNLKSYEIAAKVGFSDESYFSRSFKRVTGLSPNDFKKDSRVRKEAAV